MKILGMGNALVDVLARMKNDDLLEELNLPKGSMNLIDVHSRNHIFGKMENMDIKITTGGSAGNTCLAMSKMGMDAGFIGKVGADDYGKFYIEEFEQTGITPHFIYKEDRSGTAMALISPDGERTFGTYLGVAAELEKSDIRKDVFQEYTHFYIEGYLVQNHELIEEALSTAKSLGLKVAIDLASFNVVEEDKEFIQSLVDKYVDIVFANEEEAKALTGKEAKEAVQEIGSKIQIAVVKVGREGSWVMHEGDLVHVAVDPLTPVDTTAAGDYYAAGFFYGLANQASIYQCAQIGSLLAGQIIQVVGTKLTEDNWAEIRTNVEKILTECGNN